jgi:hypothetical protein
MLNEVVGAITSEIRGIGMIVLVLIVLAALAIAFMTLGTFTVIGILLVIAGLFFIATIKEFRIALILVVMGVILIGINYII